MYLQEVKLQSKVKCIVYKTADTFTQRDENEQDMTCELRRNNRKTEKDDHINRAEKRKCAYEDHEAGAWSRNSERRKECKRKRKPVKWISLNSFNKTGYNLC